jgi:hypothetical protein
MMRFRIVLHMAADMFTTDGTSLAGCIAHCARLEDAVKRGKYVQSVVTWSADRFDACGHLCELFEAPDGG